MERLGSWLHSLRLWIVVGIGVKRWLLVLGLGASALGVGAVYLVRTLYVQGWMPDPLWNALSLDFLPNPWWRATAALAIGAAVILLALSRLSYRLVAPFRQPGESLAQAVHRHQQQARGPRIVAIGGGTGMPSLLRGLVEYTSNLTAIVTVADDGGSSGRLRRDLGMLPPGDFRNNFAALARDEALMTQLIQYRFGAGAVQTAEGASSELQGHAFGNLVIAALTDLTGSFDAALLAMERVLALRGRVMPSTLENVQLAAEVLGRDGRRTVVVGESNIPTADGRIERVFLTPSRARAYPPALRAILEADLVVLGPGSLYTSVLPNLLLEELAQALRYSRARKVYVCNVATQPGETDGYSVADHVAAIVRHTHPACVDVVLANDNLAAAAADGARTVYVPVASPPGVKLVTADLVDAARPWRHDSAKVATAVLRLLTGRG